MTNCMELLCRIMLNTSWSTHQQLHKEGRKLRESVKMSVLCSYLIVTMDVFIDICVFLQNPVQVFANSASDGSFFTDGHVIADERTMLLSDGVGDITAVDLRTNQQARASRTCYYLIYSHALPLVVSPVHPVLTSTNPCCVCASL